MIFDKLSNKELYYPCHKNFKLGFDFIERAVKENLPLGKYELDGKNVFAMVQEYETKENNETFEGHRNYIDIQCIIAGNEFMECGEVSDFTTKKPYAPDCELFTANGNTAKLECGPDSFAIYFPNDIHKPGILLGEACNVKKIVVKVAVNPE